MKLAEQQQKLYEDFYKSTMTDSVLDAKTEALVGLASAIATNCEPCTAFYVKRCLKVGASKAEIQAVLAKVMAVASGQKRLQMQKALKEANIDIDGMA